MATALAAFLILYHLFKKLSLDIIGSSLFLDLLQLSQADQEV